MPYQPILQNTATSEIVQALSARSSEGHDAVSEASLYSHALACRYPMYSQGMVVSLTSLYGSNLGISPTVPFGASPAFEEEPLLSPRRPARSPQHAQVRRIDGLCKRAFLCLVDVSALFECDLGVLAQVLPHDVLVVSGCSRVGISRAPQNAVIQEVVRKAAPLLFLNILSEHEEMSLLTSETRWDRVGVLRVARGSACRGGGP